MHIRVENYYGDTIDAAGEFATTNTANDEALRMAQGLMPSGGGLNLIAGPGGTYTIRVYEDGLNTTAPFLAIVYIKH